MLMGFDYDIKVRIEARRPIVFERLLRIEHLARWFCGWARIEPKVGGSFRFGGETCIFRPEGRGWETRIDEGETLRRFAFTWPLQGAETRVSYELQDEGDGATILRARHTGVPSGRTEFGTVHDTWRVCLGNLKSVAEGRGDSIRPDHEPVGPEGLRLTTLIEATPDRIMAALTDPAQLDHWSTGGMPTGNARAEPVAGGAFSLGRGEGPSRVLETDSPRGIVLGWPRPEGDLRVSIRLEEKASGTAVYFSSTGYGRGEHGEVARHRGRWSDLLVCLKNFIEGGDAGFATPYEDQVREV